VLLYNNSCKFCCHIIYSTAEVAAFSFCVSMQLFEVQLWKFSHSLIWLCICNIVAMKTQTTVTMLREEKNVQCWHHLQTVTHLLVNQMSLVHLCHHCIPVWWHLVMISQHCLDDNPARDLGHCLAFTLPLMLRVLLVGRQYKHKACNSLP